MSARNSHRLAPTFVPGVIDSPSPEMLIVGISENDVKAKVLWWTHGTRQDEMLASYDRVLLAIRSVLIESSAKGSGDRNRAA